MILVIPYVWWVDSSGSEINLFFFVFNTYCFLGHPYHSTGLTCLAMSSDSTLAVTGSEDGSVYIVNITTGKVCPFCASNTTGRDHWLLFYWFHIIKHYAFNIIAFSHQQVVSSLVSHLDSVECIGLAPRYNDLSASLSALHTMASLSLSLFVLYIGWWTIKNYLTLKFSTGLSCK